MRFKFILNNKDYLEYSITRGTYHSNTIEGSTLTYAGFVVENNIIFCIVKLGSFLN